MRRRAFHAAGAAALPWHALSPARVSPCPPRRVPEALIPPAGARVMSLQDGTSKMSKSAESDMSRINLLDPTDVIVQKVKVGAAARAWGGTVRIAARRTRAARCALLPLAPDAARQDGCVRGAELG